MDAGEFQNHTVRLLRFDTLRQIDFWTDESGRPTQQNVRTCWLNQLGQALSKSSAAGEVHDCTLALSCAAT